MSSQMSSRWRTRNSAPRQWAQARDVGSGLQIAGGKQRVGERSLLIEKGDKIVVEAYRNLYRHAANIPKRDTLRGPCGLRSACLLSAGAPLALCDMRTLYLRNVPDDVIERLERLAARNGSSVSAVAIKELAEVSRRADNPALLGALPDTGIDTAQIVADLDADRADRADW